MDLYNAAELCELLGTFCNQNYPKSLVNQTFVSIYRDDEIGVMRRQARENCYRAQEKTDHQSLQKTWTFKQTYLPQRT